MSRLLLFLFIATFYSCQNRDQSQTSSSELSAPVMPVQQLNAAFLVVDGVFNSELVAPMDVLHHTVSHHDKGIRVFTIAQMRDTVTTFEGLRLIPDYAFSTDSLPTIDILVVPSAKHSMDSDLENRPLIDFVKRTGKNSAYIMSLCDGAFVLAKAGLLDTYECTTFPGDIERFRKAFPQLTVHENVSFVHDGKTITSAGGAKSYDPALYLVELLYGKKAADGIAKGLVLEWDVHQVKHVTGKH